VAEGGLHDTVDMSIAVDLAGWLSS